MTIDMFLIIFTFYDGRLNNDSITLSIFSCTPHPAFVNSNLIKPKLFSLFIKYYYPIFRLHYSRKNFSFVYPHSVKHFLITSYAIFHFLVSSCQDLFFSSFITL